MFALNAAGMMNAANQVSNVNGIAKDGNKVFIAQIRASGAPIKISNTNITIKVMANGVGLRLII